MTGTRVAGEVAVAACTASARPIAAGARARRIVASAVDVARRRVADEVTVGARRAFTRCIGAVARSPAGARPQRKKNQGTRRNLHAATLPLREHDSTFSYGQSVDPPVPGSTVPPFDGPPPTLDEPPLKTEPPLEVSPPVLVVPPLTIEPPLPVAPPALEPPPLPVPPESEPLSDPDLAPLPLWSSVEPTTGTPPAGSPPWPPPPKLSGGGRSCSGSKLQAVAPVAQTTPALNRMIRMRTSDPPLLSDNILACGPGVAHDANVHAMRPFALQRICKFEHVVASRRDR